MLLCGSSCLSALEGANGLVPHFTQNIQAEYGPWTTWQRFMEEELRFLISPREVRNINSVGRNRDAQMAKQKEIVLNKHWEEGDETLLRVASPRSLDSLSDILVPYGLRCRVQYETLV